MPLYTYVVTFKSDVHVAQGSHSNFTGFASTWASLPRSALPSLTETDRKELTQKMYSGSFQAISNAVHAWRASIDLSAGTLQVIAVQTQR